MPIVLTTIPLSADVPGAARLFDQVFVIVVAFTLLQGPTLPWVGKRLDVTAPAEPLEIIVDAAPLDDLHADLLQAQVPDGSKLHGVEIFELRLPAEASIALIVRDGHAWYPARPPCCAPVTGCSSSFPWRPASRPSAACARSAARASWPAGSASTAMAHFLSVARAAFPR